MDYVDATTALIAYPILSKDAGRDASAKAVEAHERLQKVIAGSSSKEHEPITSVPDDLLKQLFENEVGAPLTDINDLIGSQGPEDK